MGVNTTALVEDFKRMGAERGRSFLEENFRKKELRPEDFELGKVWAECFGMSSYLQCKKEYRDGGTPATTVLLEDMGAVTTAAFTSISYQIVYSAIMQGYQSEDFIFTKRIPEMPSKLLIPEKIAGITPLGRASLIRNEGEPYTLAGVGQNYIHAPSVKDRGFIVPVTREAVFMDRTGDLLRVAGDTGYSVGLDVEIRAIDCFIDLNETATSAMQGGHRYHWLDQSIPTYGDTSGTHTWDNLSASTTLTDFTQIEKGEILLSRMVDPFTGWPIMAEATDIVVTPSLLHSAKATVRATENRLQVGGYATSGNLVTRVGPNTLQSYNIIASRLLDKRQVADGGGLASTWYLANIPKAMRRKVCWPMETIQAPPNNVEEFTRQIVVQYRGNEASSFFWWEPRLSVKNTA